MKNFRFLAHPSVDGASMERRWSVDGALMEDQTPRNCRIAKLQNCTFAHLHICKTATRYFARIAALLLMLITMSVGQVWAYDWNSNVTIYFDKSATNWSDVYVIVGKSNYSRAYQMTQVEGNLYSYKMTSKWEGYSKIVFANGVGSASTGGDGTNIDNTVTSIPHTSFYEASITGDKLFIATGSGTYGLTTTDAVCFTWGTVDGFAISDGNKKLMSYDLSGEYTYDLTDLTNGQTYYFRFVVGGKEFSSGHPIVTVSTDGTKQNVNQDLTGWGTKHSCKMTATSADIHRFHYKVESSNKKTWITTQSRCTANVVNWTTAPENGVAGGSMIIAASSTGGTITYSSTNTDVADVTESAGVYTLNYKKSGTATIKAIVSGDATYCDAENTKAITVTGTGWYVVGPQGICSTTCWDDLTSNEEFLKAYGTIYYFYYSGSGTYFRVADGRTQYIPNSGSTEILNVDGTKITMKSNTEHKRSFQIENSGYICVDATNKQIWYSSIIPTSTYTVTYNANSATSGSVPTDVTNYSSGATVTVLGNTGNLARTGYDFAGWNTRSDGTGITYAAGDKFTITTNTNLYAKWTENLYTVTVSANANGTITNPAAPATTVEAGIDTKPTITATPNSHYYFKQWTADGGAAVTSSTSASTTVSATATGTVTANFTPSWSVRGDFNSWAEGNYIENYNGNEGSVDIELAAGQTYEFKIYHHDGSLYSYNGEDKVMTRGDCSDWTLYTGNNNSKITTDIAGTYRFTFNTDTKKLSVEYPCQPSSYGLWANSLEIEEFSPTGNADEYDLTFKLTDGIMNHLYVQDNCGNKYGCSTAINPNGNITLVKGLNSFRFESAAQNKTWHYIFNSNTLTLSCDAMPEEDKNINVTYDANGGYFDEGGYPTTTVVVEKYGTPYSKSVTPIRDGYTFTDWYDAASDGSVITNVTNALAHSVYAHWNAIQITAVNVTGDLGVGKTLTVTPTFDHNPGSVTVCYGLYDNNNVLQDVSFSEPSNEGVSTFAVPAAGTYYVKMSMKVGGCGGTLISEAQSANFTVTNNYTVTYAVVGENGTLSGPDGTTVDGVTTASVTGGTNVTFTTTRATGYSVEGWYSDKDCANSIGTRGETSLTIENISADASVYVRFWAPADVNGITIRNAANDNLVTGETITATPSVRSAGKGNKAYCWTLTKGGNTIATEFTSAGNKAVNFSVKDAGNYTLTLTVHSEGTCSGLVDGSYDQAFTVNEDEWYIVGEPDTWQGTGFWSYSNLGNLTPDSKDTHTNNVRLIFQKDNEGNFFFGPFQFDENKDQNWSYKYFRLYNKGKNAQYVAQSVGNFGLDASFDGKTKSVTLKKESSICFNANLTGRNYYLFVKDGKMWVGSEEPHVDIRTRLKIVTGENPSRTFYSNEVVLPEDGSASDMISFYAQRTATITLERFVMGTGWTDNAEKTKFSFTAPQIAKDSIYVAKLVMGTENAGVSPVSVGDVAFYDGTYYIRTSAAAGGWNDYQTYADNVMHKSDFLMNKNGYDYFYVNWVLKDKKINYQIANKYNPAISEEFRNDAITSTTTLPADANIRYMWNSQSNTFDRAYISGSSKISDRFLVLEGDAKLFDKDGNALNISGLRANELNFADNGNWIYQADAKAQPGARAKLTAKYNGTTQYFWGKVGERTEETTEQIFGGTGENLYRIRLIYDFKTNRLLSAWLADDSNNPVGEELKIDADVMIVRKHQEPAQQITFENSGKLLDVKTVYGVMQFDKYTLNNRDNDGNILPVENRKSSYERYLYWVSFPFDVKLNEVFGFGNYGEHWVLQYYDGTARAANGFWADVDTYWKTVSVEESRDFVMQKNTGYVISLTPLKVYYSSDIFNHTSEVALYFPSAAPVETIDGELPAAGQFIVPGHHCTITRDDRNIKDSHWNVMGVPGYADVLAQNVPDQQSFVWNGVRMDDIKFIYEWNKATNALEPFENTKNFTFQTMHSYMVQYAGGINWQGGVVPTVLAAARRAQTDDENKTIKLVLKQGDKDVDRTFVAMDDEATNSFDMNKDMCKVFKSDANIYTMIDYSIEVAGNVMPTPTTQTFIPVGVKIAADGEYTFAMPEGTNGEAVYLIDYDENITTNISIMDYTVTLTAGTINDRFALKFVPKGGIVTGMENTDADGNKTVKYLENGQLRILRDGRIFDAQGRVTK